MDSWVGCLMDFRTTAGHANVQEQLGCTMLQIPASPVPLVCSPLGLRGEMPHMSVRLHPMESHASSQVRTEEEKCQGGMKH